MVVAYILVEKRERCWGLDERLEEIDGVMESYPLSISGVHNEDPTKIVVYHYLVKVEGKSCEDIRNINFKHIRELEGVGDTLTLLPSDYMNQALDCC
jgi:hypothetical protein